MNFSRNIYLDVSTSVCGFERHFYIKWNFPHIIVLEIFLWRIGILGKNWWSSWKNKKKMNVKKFKDIKSLVWWYTIESMSIVDWYTTSLSFLRRFIYPLILESGFFNDKVFCYHKNVIMMRSVAKRCWIKVWTSKHLQKII